MKKYDEGYALPFVLVVMVIMCLIGVSVLSFSLGNLQNQKASIARMQDRYAAEGQIERVIAYLNEKNGISSDILDAICNEGVTEIVKDTVVVSFATDSSTDVEKIELTLETQVGTVKVMSIIEITGNIKLNDGIYVYSTKPTYKYLSYEITNVPEGGEANESSIIMP